MDDVLNAGTFGSIHQVFALTEHIDGVTSSHEDPVNVFERRGKGFDLVQVEVDGRYYKSCRLLPIACGSDHVNRFILGEQRN
jgi:hypothetical protein